MNLVVRDSILDFQVVSLEHILVMKVSQSWQLGCLPKIGMLRYGSGICSDEQFKVCERELSS